MSKSKALTLFSIPVSDLHKVMSGIVGVTEPTHVREVFRHVLINIFPDGKLELMISTGERELIVTTTCEANVSEQDSIFVNCKQLSDILGTLTKEDSVKFSWKDSKRNILTLDCSNVNHQLRVIDEAFPKIPEEAESLSTVTVPAAQFHEMLKHVNFAASVQSHRKSLNGVYVTIDSGKLCAVATDGHRLALDATALENAPEASTHFTLPNKSVNSLMQLIAATAGTLTINFFENIVRFSTDEFQFTSGIIDEAFPDYNRVIPRNNEVSFEIDREVLLQSMTRVSVLQERNRAIKWSVAADSLKMSAGTMAEEMSIAQCRIDNGNFPDDTAIDISFNATFITGVLGNVKSKRASIFIKDSAHSMLMKMPDYPEFLYVVMPMIL